jgi:Fe-S-cluster containining protein
MAESEEKRSSGTSKALCAACGGMCCRYVAVEIDKPTCKRDYDHIRWYLLHEKVHVFLDHEKRWFVEFETPCSALQADAACGNYAERPRICRQHGEGAVECEYVSDDQPFRRRFSTATEFEDYLDRKRVLWRWTWPGRRLQCAGDATS